MAHEPPYDADTYVPQTGRALAPVCPPKIGGLKFTPDLLYFHFREVGKTSDFQPFTIKNESPANIGLGALTISGEFEILGNAPTLLQPNESVTLQVRFRPLTEGTRLGSVNIQSNSGTPEPKVRLVGIGGVLVANVPANPAQVQAIVNQYLGQAWAYRYGTFAPSNIVANEILMDHHVTTMHTLQPNFAGCGFSIGSLPAANWELRVLNGIVQIGTITISPTGVITRMTTGGLAIGIAANSIITVLAPVTADPSVIRLRMTFVGIV